ncbi:Acetyltransferase (GNAT) family protein [Enhydrobacter aerosaccus]|uniref:Acetyltransferase (GNAT) family protein n=1 Tax=Enhydrobacter aerosaccus TaxID=225324 RepID=A0A1T4MZ20_9HYPH|nr:GNAT family N-acetyltransferase [Enhydrobacter aerosaccus]SJZ72350.1 Acetyltransferase (GNAT) family protein [Enhydrobacter aerosaccus]
MDEKIELVFDPHNAAAAEYVHKRLSAFNAAATGRSDFYPVNIFLIGDKGERLGGLLGYVWSDWLYVAILWVDEALRGKGQATRLMDAAEDYARQRGCHSASLDTHSFQARPFYEKRGYEVFATLDDYPKGHQKFFLRKKLS